MRFDGRELWGADADPTVTVSVDAWEPYGAVVIVIPGAQHGRVHAVLLLPVAVLGLPPLWYKSAPYRSRTVADPRGVLSRFRRRIAEGHGNPRVDSTAELRYLVVPMRPSGTEG